MQCSHKFMKNNKNNNAKNGDEITRLYDIFIDKIILYILQPAFI